MKPLVYKILIHAHQTTEHMGIETHDGVLFEWFVVWEWTLDKCLFSAVRECSKYGYCDLFPIKNVLFENEYVSI